MAIDAALPLEAVPPATCSRSFMTRSAPGTYHALAYRPSAKSDNPPLTCCDFNMAAVCRYEFGRK